MSDIVEYALSRSSKRSHAPSQVDWIDERAALRVEEIEWGDEFDPYHQRGHIADSVLRLPSYPDARREDLAIWHGVLEAALAEARTSRRVDRVVASESTAVSPATALAIQPRLPWLGFSLYYRLLWSVLGALGMIWGVLSGITFAAGVGIGIATAVTGLVAIAGLMLILFGAGRAHGSA